AHARAARARGADRRREPGRTGAPAHRARQPQRAPAVSRAASRAAGQDAALARDRNERAGAVRAGRRGGELLQAPAAFEYERATSVDGALAALQRVGPGARLIAGGHSLLPMMKLRLANPEHLVDINEVPDLDYIREDAATGEIRIGALARHVDLLKSELLARRFPVFADAEEGIADPVVRNRGTIGGSLCQADAAEDLSAVCVAAKAKVVIRGAQGERVVGMDGFYTGPFMTAVGDGEMLTEIRLPVKAGAGSAHE